MRKVFLYTSLFTLIFGLWALPVGALTITYGDDFSSPGLPDWTGVTYATNTSSGGSYTRIDGTNPYLQSTHVYSGTPTPTKVISFFLKDGALYDPSGGEILSIDYSELARTDSTTDGASGAFSGMMLQQGGNYFIGPSDYTYDYSTYGTTLWKNITYNDLTSTNFSMVTDLSIDGSGNYLWAGTTSSVNPDFSTSGSSIKFGFYRHDSHTYSSTATRVTGIDNWSVSTEVTPIPEPTTMLLLGTGLIGLARGRRKMK